MTNITNLIIAIVSAAGFLWLAGSKIYNMYFTAKIDLEVGKEVKINQAISDIEKQTQTDKETLSEDLIKLNNDTKPSNSSNS